MNSENIGGFFKMKFCASTAFEKDWLTAGSDLEHVLDSFC